MADTEYATKLPPTSPEIAVGLTFGSSYVKVKWFLGTVDAAIERAIRSALDLPQAVEMRMVDVDGFNVPICAQLPSGEYKVLLVETSVVPGRGSESSLSDWMPTTRGISMGLSASVRQGISELKEPLLEGLDSTIERQSVLEERLTKFERVSSHLANERTFLAWVRTAVSVAGLAITFSTEFYKPNLSILYWIGSIFAWLVGISFFGSGVNRYWTVKGVLNRNKKDITNNWGRKGISTQVILFGVLLALVSALYVNIVYSEAADSTSN
jgi:putative membrane protein